MSYRSSLLALAVVAGLAHAGPPPTDLYGDPLPEGVVLRLGTARLKSSASQMLFTPDGKTLITLESGRMVRRWNAEDGRLQQSFALPRPYWSPERLSPSGSAFFSNDGEGGSAVWDVSSGQRMVQFPGLQCCGAAFTPDGATVVAVDGMGVIHLMDVRSGKEKRAFAAPYKSWQISLSPDGARMAVLTQEAWVGLETATGRELWRLAERPTPFAWAPDSAAVAAYFESPKEEGKEKHSGGTIRFLNAADGTPSGRDPVAQDSDLVDLQFSPDGATLALRTKNEIVLWDLEAKRARRRFPLSPTGYYSREPLLFAPDGKTLTALVGTELHRWDLSSGKDLYPDVSLRGSDGFVHALAWSPDGKRIASMSQSLDAGLRIWDADSGRLLRALPQPDGAQWWGSWVAFSPDGKHVFTAFPFGKMRCYDVETGKEIWSQDPFDPDPKDREPLLAKLQVSADGEHLFTTRLSQHSWPCSGETIVWNAATGAREQIWAVEQASDRDVFSPNGRLRYHWNGEVCDEWTGSVRFTLSARHELWAFGTPVGVCSPDGALFASFTQENIAKPVCFDTVCRGIQVWEAATGKSVAEIPETQFGGFAFSPDGRTIAVADEDDLRVWDVVSAKEVYRRPMANRLLGSRPPLAFSPDGRRIAVPCTDTTVLVFDLSAAMRHDRIAPPWTAADRNALWADLADADAAKAYAAIDRLAARPDDAAALLGDRLRPAVGVSKDRVHRLIAALDADDFDAREAASRQLADIAEQVEPTLHNALTADDLTPEQRSRIGKALASLPAAPPTETLRGLRAVRALAWADSPDARAVLEKLADGAADDALTHEARAALDRWKKEKQPPAPPDRQP